ncbi:MAG: MarR family transcriptional regulator [Chthoniobacterales bacterium]
MSESDTEQQTPVEELTDIIMGLQRCFMMNLSKELSRGQMSFPQYFLLGHIGGQNSLTMSEIAVKMNHTTAAATGMIDRLEKLGYVQRIHAENDRRKVMVKITRKGSALVTHIRQDITNNLALIMEILTEEERHAWLSIYRKIFAYCQNKPEEKK